MEIQSKSVITSGSSVQRFLQGANNLFTIKIQHVMKCCALCWACTVNGRDVQCIQGFDQKP
jgi:hypothetical protein